METAKNITRLSASAGLGLSLGAVLERLGTIPHELTHVAAAHIVGIGGKINELDLISGSGSMIPYENFSHWQGAIIRLAPHLTIPPVELFTAGILTKMAWNMIQEENTYCGLPLAVAAVLFVNAFQYPAELLIGGNPENDLLFAAHHITQMLEHLPSNYDMKQLLSWGIITENVAGGLSLATMWHKLKESF